MMSPTYPLDPRSAAAAQVRATLQDRERALRAEIEAARQQGRSDPSSIAREVRDREEEAEAQIATGINDAEIGRDVAELREIGEALQRLDAGRYGQCKDCNDAIDPRRLAAEPFAVRCTRCQGQLEQSRQRLA
jgi:RNA polymerase-binding transcription factor DksA